MRSWSSPGRPSRVGLAVITKEATKSIDRMVAQFYAPNVLDGLRWVSEEPVARAS